MEQNIGINEVDARLDKLAGDLVTRKEYYIGYPVNQKSRLIPMSNTVYFHRPSDLVMTKYDLAPDYDERLGGDLAHIVVMQHVGRELLEAFVDDLRSLS